MKKQMILVMVISMATKAAIACGICGCQATGSYLGVLPQYQKNFFGARYNYRSFESTHPNSIIPGLTGRKSVETFQSLEFMGRYVPGKRMQVIGMIALQQMQQKINTTVSSSQGISDASLTFYYSVLPGKIRAGKSWRHLLQAGYGLKLPTGKNTWHNETEEYNPSLQLGTGSMDHLVSAIYTARTKNFGSLSDVNFQLNGTNKYGYRFGSKLTATSRIFYTITRCRNTWMMHTGIYGEFSAADHFKNKYQYNTGGSLIMPVAGLDMFRKNWSAGINYRTPAWQNISGGYVKSNARLLLSVSLLF